MTWESRDLPVLRAIVELADAGDGYVDANDLVEHTGMDARTVQRALVALAGEEPPFFAVEDGSSMGGRHIMGVDVPTGHARRTVQVWPLPPPEALLEQLLAVIEQQAESGPPQERPKWRRLLHAVTGIGRDVLVEVAGAAISRSAGLS